MAEEIKKKESVLDAAADLLPRPSKDVIQGAHCSYDILEVLGKGGFGAVFKIRRIHDNALLAMKCEVNTSKKPLLPHELRVLVAALKVHSPHLLRYEDRGAIRDRFKFVIFHLAGKKNLWELRMSQKDKKFSLVSSLRLAEQSLAAIRDLHRSGYLHRDIKPPNFALGREEDQAQHTVIILDFGLCRRYRSLERDVRHPRVKAAFRGTTRYASVNCLQLKDQSRKDDIESWWYMIVEWTVGRLPWKSCKGTERKEVLEYKKQLRKDENMKATLTSYPGVASYLSKILKYLDELEFNKIPDYDYVYSLIAAAQKANKCDLQAAPEWDTESNWKGPNYLVGINYNMADQ